MAVNGIEIKVGQEWETRNGIKITVLNYEPRHAFPWKCSHGAVGDEGNWSHACNENEGDLMRLLPKNPPEAFLERDAGEIPGDQVVDAEFKLQPPASAPDLLDRAAGHMKARAATYDQPQGERSMEKTVALFNLHHGTSLTEAQGWHFMRILKDVRLFTRDGYHADSGEDGVAYQALMVEAKSKEATK